jgi:hypothetical protein
VRNGVSFDSGHDLKKWLELSRFEDVVGSGRSESVSIAYGTVFRQWNSVHRYYSGQFLRAYFRAARVDRGIKGDALKELSRRLYSAARLIVTEGDMRWKNWKQ